jgi:hypothetical protein
MPDKYYLRSLDIWHRQHRLLVSAMEIVRQCLSIPPVPCLASAFSTFKFIWSSVEQLQVGKSQLAALTQSIAQLLRTLDEEYRTGRFLQARSSVALADLCRFVRCTPPTNLTYISPCRLLDDISNFVQKEASKSFLKRLFTKNQSVARTDGYYASVGMIIESFQASYNTFESSSLINTARHADLKFVRHQ